MPLLLVLVSLSLRLAHAEIDPSSATLLGESKSSPSAGLQSGRYETTGAALEPEKPELSSKPIPKPRRVEPVTFVAPPAQKAARKTITDATGIPTAVIQPKLRRWTASNPEPAKEAGPKEGAASEAAKEGAGEPTALAASEDSDARELSKVEIELHSGIAHQDAKSNSVYRNFSMTAPIAGIGGSVWLSDHMGFSGHYRTTLSADIGSATESNSRVPVTAEWSDLHWSFRKVFGGGPKAKTLEYGFSYFDNSLKAPAGDPTRSTLKSSGFGLDSRLLLPSSKTYTWVLGSAIYPRIRHTESAGSSGLQSGSDPESARFDFSVGGDLRLASTNDVFWNLSMNLEKDQYGGSATINEPSGAPAENVSVLTTTLFFHLGYRWGR